MLQVFHFHGNKKWNLNTDYFQTISACPLKLAGTYDTASSGVKFFFLERENKNGDRGSKEPCLSNGGLKMQPFLLETAALWLSKQRKEK